MATLPPLFTALIVIASSLIGGSEQGLGAQSRGTLNQPASSSQAVARPSSYELIARALEAKRIDQETAHKYRVFAAFGDSRLPAAFRGANGGFELPPEVEQVGQQWESLSAQTRAELAPFFRRPDEPGSWIELQSVSGQERGEAAPPSGRERRGLELSFGPVGRGRAEARLASLAAPPPDRPRVSSRSTARPSATPAITWRSFSAAGGKAKVWAQDRYPGDAAKAQVLASEITRIIWNKIVNLMGPEPLSDVNRPPNGGDGAFDFYLIHAPIVVDPLTQARRKAYLGLTTAGLSRVPCGTSYVLIDSNEPIGSPTSPGILSTAAHEFMHAVTRAFRPRDNSGCGDIWITEASGAWAENFVYPRANSEHIWPDEFMKHPRWPVDQADSAHHYGAYLLPYFMEKAGGGEQFMPAIWERMRTKRSLEAINDVMPDGWKKWWPRFLNTTWNQPPLDRPNGYAAWDGMLKAPRGWHLNLDVRPGPAEQPITFDADPTAGPPGLPYLSGGYFEFKLTDRVRSMTFDNTMALLPHASVWGIQKIRGAWKKPEDWTSALNKAWCRDDASEDISELILVFGNSDWRTKTTIRPATDPKLKVFPTGCVAWSGTSRTTNTIVSTDPKLTITEVVTSSMRFVVDSALMLPGQLRQYWKVESGTLTWNVSVTGQCTAMSGGTVAIRDMGPGDQVASLNIYEENRIMVVSGSQGPWPGQVPSYTLTCPRSNEPPPKMVLFSALGWFNTDGDHNALAADGKSFRGDYTVRSPSGNGGGTRYQYEFRVSP